MNAFQIKQNIDYVWEKFCEEVDVYDFAFRLSEAEILAQQTDRSDPHREPVAVVVELQMFVIKIISRHLKIAYARLHIWGIVYDAIIDRLKRLVS